MIIRWTDLEPGDIVKVSSGVKHGQFWTHEEWANRELVINSVRVEENIYKEIIIKVGVDDYMFNLRENGVHYFLRDEGEFFEIVRLGAA